MDKNPTLDKKEKLSKAQIDKNYIEKLKSTQKYDDYKKKRAAAQKERRKKVKEAEHEMPIMKMKNVVESRRKAVRERVQRHRKYATSNSMHAQSSTYATSTVRGNIKFMKIKPLMQKKLINPHKHLVKQ